MRFLPRLFAISLFAMTANSWPAFADSMIEVEFTYDLRQSAEWNYAEIKRVADDACQTDDILTSVVGIYQHFDQSECEAELVEQAISGIDIVELTALHSPKTER